MKTLILSVTTFAGFSLAGFAQGTISFDGSNNSNPSPTATSSGLVFINGVSDTGTDINAELLYATSPSGIYGFGFSGTPVVTLLLASSAQGPTTSIGQTLAALGDITGFANGTLYDQSGSTFQIPNIAAGATAYFQVEAWTGNYNSYNQAMFSDNALIAITPVFSEVLGSGAPVTADIDNMPALNLVSNLVPEPSTLAMAGVGIGSMLIFGIRKTLGQLAKSNLPDSVAWTEDLATAAQSHKENMRSLPLRGRSEVFASR